MRARFVGLILILLLLIVPLLPPGYATTTITSTQVATTNTVTDKLVVGLPAVDMTYATWVSNASRFNGTINASASVGSTSFLQVSNWSSSYLYNLTNATATANRTATLPDHSGTFGYVDFAETVTAAWTFSANPNFNTNGIPWASVSKSGSSLADLATRDAADLTGTLPDARLSSNVAMRNADNAFTTTGTQSAAGNFAAPKGFFPILLANTSIGLGASPGANTLFRLNGIVTISGGGGQLMLLDGTLTAVANGDDMHGYRVNPAYATGTFTGLDANGIYLDGANFQKTGTGTIATARGLYITAPTVGTSNLAMETAGGTSLFAGTLQMNTGSGILLNDGVNINVGATTGTTIGESGDKLAVFGTTPAARSACPADPTGGAIVDAQARAATVSLIDILQQHGWCA